MSPATSDAQLIALIERIARRPPPGGAPDAGRDAEAALKALYDATASKLYGLALRVVRSADHAEDVLQEAYLTVWRSAGDYRASLSPPLAWMGVITRSRALDFLRRRASERADAHTELDAHLGDTLAGHDANPMDTAQASEQAWALHECLRKLDTQQREVVSLAYLRDLTHSELAQRLQLPLGTVKTWIRRGLDSLRLCLRGVA
jgi:RNA polymerase sigma-70 factor (ECF subfamily)